MTKPKVDDDLAAYFFDEARIPVRLAALTGQDYPAIVSLWSLRKDGKLYCATKKWAYIVTKIEKNPGVAFELSCEEPPYRGVRGWADARIVPERGEEILSELLEKFLGSNDTPFARKLLADAKENEVAIELNPVWMKTWDYAERMSGCDSATTYERS